MLDTGYFQVIGADKLKLKVLEIIVKLHWEYEQVIVVLYEISAGII